MFTPTWMVVEKFLSGRCESLLKHRPAWAMLGWHKQIRSWIREALKKEGYSDVGKVVQKRNKYSTHVSFVDISRGGVFCKVTEICIQEAVFTKWISDMFPEVVPGILSVSPNLNAFLMKDFTASHVEESLNTKEEGKKLLLYFGRTQVELAESLKDPVVFEGCPFEKLLTPRKLFGRIEELFDDHEVKSQLTPEQQDDFKNHSKIPSEMCDRVEDAGIPCSVVHGDLLGGNCAVSKRIRMPLSILIGTTVACRTLSLSPTCIKSVTICLIRTFTSIMTCGDNGAVGRRHKRLQNWHASLLLCLRQSTRMMPESIAQELCKV